MSRCIIVNQMYGTSVDALCSVEAGGGAPTDASWSP